MGTKNLEHEDHRYEGESPSFDGTSSRRVNGEPRGTHMSRDGDGSLGEAGGDDDSDGDGDEAALSNTTGNTQADASGEAEKKKKKKKPKKKKKKTAASTSVVEQTNPPRVPLADIYPAGNYPEGEIQLYTKQRTAAAESKSNARLSHFQDEDFLKNYRKAAEVHRSARRWVHENVKPGATLLSIAEGIEDSVRAMLGHSGLEPGDSLKAGMGFPTGLCLNHQTAHYTPNPGQKDVVLQYSDVMKVDYGVHINGWIVDSAFTMSFDPVYDNLLAAVKDATNTGIQTVGIDVRISDISAAIQEAMESYEVEIKGKTHRVKAVRNITAHDIKQWHIHGGKSIPFIKNSDQTKIEEGEVLAIETFGTTGRGILRDDVGVYGYGLNHNAPLTGSVPLSSARKVHKAIRENFGTIVFCRRYLERLGVERYLAGMNYLVANDIVEAYAPLMDVEGSYSAQFEHTLVLRENHKEILSRGDDY